MKEKQFCFVPTVSALALSNWEEKLNQDLLLPATNYFLTGKTGFEQVNAYFANAFHTRFNNSALFLYNWLNEPYLHIPAISPVIGTYSVPNNTTLYIQRGQLLEVNGGTVTNANIVAYPGSKIVLKNGGIIQLRNNGTLDMWRGAILDMQNGDIKITP